MEIINTVSNKSIYLQAGGRVCGFRGDTVSFNCEDLDALIKLTPEQLHSYISNGLRPRLMKTETLITLTKPLVTIGQPKKAPQ